MGEVINKLNKEKKMIGDNQSKAFEDLQVSEDKVAHLNSIKSKLESTFAELEDGVNREKRSRTDVGKTRRKVEGELKVSQETVNDLEQNKRSLENIIGKKEKDISVLNAKLEDEQSLVAKVQKAIKEELKNKRKSLKLRDRQEQRLRGKDLILQESL